MFFITFEGIDQSGKSTQLKLLAAGMEAAGLSILSVREPGATPLGEAIRGLLLGPEHQAMDSWAEALLYAAARTQLVKDVIKPALMSGKIVLSDRFIDSSLVYQGIARGLGIERIMELNMGATGGLMPDLTLVFHLDAEASRARREGRETGQDRIESEPIEFHRMVEEGYQLLEEMYPARIAGINAAQTIEKVHAEVVRQCRERLGIEL